MDIPVWGWILIAIVGIIILVFLAKSGALGEGLSDVADSIDFSGGDD